MPLLASEAHVMVTDGRYDSTNRFDWIVGVPAAADTYLPVGTIMNRSAAMCWTTHENDSWFRSVSTAYEPPTYVHPAPYPESGAANPAHPVPFTN